MARVWWEGFDHRAGTTQMQQQYAAVTGTLYVAGRFGGFAWDMDPGNNFIKTLPAADRYSVGFALRATTLLTMAAASTRVASFGYGAITGTGHTSHVYLAFDEGGRIYIKTGAGATLFTSDPLVIALNTWHFISFAAIVSDTVGQVSLAIDGLTIANLSGLDTKNGATGTADMCVFYLGSSLGSADVLIDDLYIDDTYAILPERRVEMIVPNIEGATIQWIPSTGTDNSATVDENPPSTTDYNSASAVGELDLLGCTTLVATPASIDGVKVIGFGAKTDAASRQVAYGIKSGGITNNGATFELTATMKYEANLFLTDPGTSAAWVKAGIDALELQPKVIT